jgi:hypothetical protein
MVMNQPEDGPLTKLLAEAMLEYVEDLGSLIDSDIKNLTFIAADKNPTAIGPGHRGDPSLPTSGIMLPNLLPLVITGMTSRAHARDPIADSKRGIKHDPS